MQSPAPLLLEAILTAIRPEHIAEMKYNDCFEESAKVNQGANSIFITLKPGIGYSRNTGSYVLADGETPAGARAVVSDLASGPVAPYRARLLGLFDDATGAPVEGAEVLDILTGTRGLTSETGTISLAFVTDGGSLIRIQKAGYQPMTMSVMISPVDTVPITLTLAHKN
jgi:hypothetical protein